MKHFIILCLLILPFTKLCSQTEEDKPEIKAAFTAGILKGGGSIFGFEFEKQVYRNVGLQIGAGLSSLSAAFNIHFKPRLNSSFLSVQYAQQGMGLRFVQDIFSVSYVFRAKKYFACQIGYGWPLSRGPAYPKGKVQPSQLLVYAIGAYFPF
jgi:hypothetical protein